MKNLEISRNILNNGYHNYIVIPGVCPRYSYTIGLFEMVGFELILGGMCLLDTTQLSILFEGFVHLCKHDINSLNYCIRECFGDFTLQPADQTWSEFAGFGASHYYQRNDIKFMQILSKDIRNIDDSDMSLSVYNNRCWKYLSEKWPYAVDHSSEVLLDDKAIKGDAISLISRYESDYWEMFSDKEFTFNGENAKIFPLSVILESWPNLSEIVTMEINSVINL